MHRSLRVPAGWLLGLLALFATIPAGGVSAPRRIRVFVALCDNATQGIQPVPAKIGNGEDPAANLYWGCTDGLKSWFRASRLWRLEKTETDLSPRVLERLTFRHVATGAILVADAYRGSQMRACLEDFERALASGEDDLVAFIGHNGLMDGSIESTAPTPGARRPDAVVLCCRSAAYFQPRLGALGARAVLLTEQLMYPGAFILHDVIERWLRGGSTAQFRDAAATAYARNQHISLRAAAGVFTPAERLPP